MAVNETTDCLPEMRRLQFTGWAGLALLGLLLGLAWGLRPAGQWLLQAGLLWLLVCYECRRRLHLNRSSADAVAYPSLGPANRLTILRGWLIAATGGFLFLSWPGALLAWLPGLLYMAAAVIDRVDGYIARRRGHVSQLGNELDTVFDALGLAVAPLLAVWYGQIHWSYLLVSIAYYLFRLGLAWRRRRGLPLWPLAPSLSRRALAGFQMGFVAVVLLPVFRPPLTTLAGVIFMLPLLAGFASDWLTVCGYQLRRRAELTERVILPGLRVVVFALLLWQFLPIGTGLLQQRLPEAAGLTLVCGLLLAGCLILLGILGRIAALGLIGLLGWWYSLQAPGLPQYLLLCCAVWLLLFGTGRFSLWSPDGDWVNRYDGGQ